MKEFKGTPGPWEVKLIRGDVNVIRRGSFRNEGVTAFSCQSVVNAIDDVDDAQLIAAAPELLSAIQHLVEVYDSEDGKQWTTASKKAAIAEARAAIDKALGE